MTGPRFCNHGLSPRRLVFEAIRELDTTTTELLSIYTGLSGPQVRAVLKLERYGWCDIVDHMTNKAETAIWQYQGPGAPP